MSGEGDTKRAAVLDCHIRLLGAQLTLMGNNLGVELGFDAAGAPDERLTSFVNERVQHTLLAAALPIATERWSLLKASIALQ